MDERTQIIETELRRLGADLVGFGNLEGLEKDARGGFPVGIAVAAAYPGAVIRGISELPTREYREWFGRLNERLDEIVTRGAEMIRAMGYNAAARTRARVGEGGIARRTALPHKTVATRAGIGWIGKCALLVTERYGAAVRLSSILTDAPLRTAAPIDAARCGDCMVCVKACPAIAATGQAWRAGLDRDEFFDAAKCAETAKARAKRGLGVETTLCGKCIEICPHTQRYTGTDAAK